jgi:L-2,4-diaminobutyric acid acetyltransferase
MTRVEAKAMSIVYRKPGLADAASIHALIDECKPLDLNSPYAYMLLCTDFADTCAVAQREGRLVGFVSGYRKPDDNSVLFVWQVAVSPRGRKQGVGKGLLEEIIARPEQAAVRHLEATINPSNRASWALFETFAKKRGARCATQTLFREEHFGHQGHEEERLLRISPLESPRGTKDNHAHI